MKMKFYQNRSNCYDQMDYMRQSNTIQFEEDPFAENAKSIAQFYHEVVLILKYLQTMTQVGSMKIIYYELYYTVIKSLSEEGKN